MRSPREQAGHLRLALAMTLVDKDAAIARADRTVLALDDPPVEVIAVSLAGDQPPDEVIRLLGSMPGPGDLAAMAHQVLGLLHGRLEAGEVTLERAVEMLSAYSVWAGVPEHEKLEAEDLREYLDLANVGDYGTLDRVREEVLTFLDRHMTRPTTP